MGAQRHGFSRLRHGARAFAFGNPLYNLTLGGRTPTGLAIPVPLDPWPGDSALGAAIINGQFRLAGQTVQTAEPIWAPASANPAWLRAVHGFEWLRDLRAVGGDAARRHARMLVTNWLDRNAAWNATAWAPEVLGARVANWIGQHDFYCLSADDGFRARVFESLARQIRHLVRVVPGDLQGAALLSAIKGLIYGGLALPGADKALGHGMHLLERELPRQVLPDGGHVERNPTVHLAVLRHLIDLRTALRTARAEVPEGLQHAIDRMTPALRFFRHGDGGLALFNGGREGEPVVIDAALAQADARGRPLRSAPHCGFERLIAGRSLVLMDTGRPSPPGLDLTAHAGTLSFEFSVGRERLIVNCGAHAGETGAWRSGLAATAAHSVVTVGETNSAEVLEGGGLGRRPSRITCERIEGDGAALVEASHDGYVRHFGLVHRRRLYLADSGEDLRGEDTLEGPAGQSFAVRFHLHPAVHVELAQNGTLALLRLQSGHAWRLRAAGGGLELAESIYLGQGDEPQRTSQIVINGDTVPERTVIKWALHREKKPA